MSLASPTKTDDLIIKIVTNEEKVKQFFEKNFENSYTVKELIGTYKFTSNIRRILKKLEENKVLAKTSVKRGKRWEFAYYLRSSEKFAEKFTEAFSKVTSSNKTSSWKLDQMIDLIIKYPHIQDLFEVLQENEDLRKLIFLHRDELFGENMFNRYLHMINTSHSEETSHRGLKTILKNEGPKYDWEIDNLLGMLAQDKEKAEKLKSDFKDLFTYFLIEIPRKNKNLLKLITDPHFSFHYVQERIPDFDKFWNGIFENLDVEPNIRRKLGNLMVQFFKNIYENFEDIIDQISDFFPKIFPSFHQESLKRMTEIITRLDIEKEIYFQNLDELYSLGLLESKSMFSWCENCLIDIPIYSSRIGEIAPRKLLRSKCLNCNESEAVVSLFGIDSVLKDLIYSKDGILSAYFNWILHQNKLKYIVGKQLDDTEIDFVISQTLIECKMYQSNKDDKSIRASLENVISQMKKQILSLRSEGIKIKTAVLLWNLDKNIEKITNMLNQKAQQFLIEYNFQVINPSSISAFLENLIDDR
ncbi:MAG: hypothetical protein HeimC2_35310 [Candidatus Heimdallarchaeota archaeon LC_2]|nr:MAG: hypothetical protein HeimC2_35310 [Candidatus Heimdallarchaeota archaeon LC_2]